MKSIIQFPHPGGEHNVKSGTKWNIGNHKRKYLKISGSYLEKTTSLPLEDLVYFWGEWESQSSITPISRENSVDFPNYFFEPFYTLPIPYNGCNTDPFVFGDQFYYCICKQGHYPSLRKIEKGDMILFGSNLNQHFVLDTVFVVKDSNEYDFQNIDSLKSEYNEVFYDVSLLPLNNTFAVKPKDIVDDTERSGCFIPKSGDDETDYKPTCHPSGDLKNKIYKAAMYNDRHDFDDIFSFSPCLPEPFGKEGFARPSLDLPFISQGLTQGIKIIKSEDVKTIWLQIINEVLKQGLCIMIKTDLPEKVQNL
jgi:hypothetical protein